MKQALLAVSFGTSVPRARQDIEAVERVLAAGAPERAFCRAYTSPTIRRILAERGEPVSGLPEALEALAAAGVEDVAVQPTHLLYGFEYDKLKADAAAFAGRFARLALGRPLAADSESLRALAACMARRFGQPEGGALVLLGHGTEHFANMVYPAMQTALRLAGGRRAYMGTVEGWPGFDEVLAQLRRLLPEDIGALTLDYAPERFHARLSAVEKTYVYRLWNSDRPDVFARRYRACDPRPLDCDAMRAGAAGLVGTHDFFTFCANRQMKKSTVRTLRRLDITQEDAELRFTLTADGFLYHMARILVGTLLEVGLGRRTAESLPALFDARCRALAGETAPAKGLWLMEVQY